MRSKPEVLQNAIYIFQNFFTSEECDKIKELFDEYEKRPAQTIGYDLDKHNKDFEGDTKEEPDIRKGHVRFPSNNNFRNTEYWDRIMMALDHVSQDSGIIVKDDSVDIQYTMYDNEGDFFDWHKDDVVSLAQFKGNTRKLSGTLQLSDRDEYEGCELWLRLTGKGDNMVANKQKGSFIVFPSWLDHKVTKLESGVRHSLVLWYMGPAWR